MPHLRESGPLPNSFDGDAFFGEAPRCVASAGRKPGGLALPSLILGDLLKCSDYIRASPDVSPFPELFGICVIRFGPFGGVALASGSVFWHPPQCARWGASRLA